MRESNYSISCYLLSFSITLPPMNGNMYHFLQNNSIEFNHEENLFYADPPLPSLWCPGLSSSVSHTAFLCIITSSSVRLLGNTSNSLFRRGTNWWCGRGRKGNQVSACQNNEIKSGRWWWWWWRGSNLYRAKWDGTWEKCLTHSKEKNWFQI